MGDKGNQKHHMNTDYTVADEIADRALLFSTAKTYIHNFDDMGANDKFRVIMSSGEPLLVKELYSYVYHSIKRAELSSIIHQSSNYPPVVITKNCMLNVVCLV